jgi:hypothetical protein
MSLLNKQNAKKTHAFNTFDFIDGWRHLGLCHDWPLPFLLVLSCFQHDWLLLQRLVWCLALMMQYLLPVSWLLALLW